DELEREIPLGAFETVLREYETQPWLKAPKKDQQLKEQLSRFRDVVGLFEVVLKQGREERVAQWRETWPKLAPVEVDGRNILGTDTVRADGFVPPPTAPLDPGGDLDASYEVATVFGLTNRLDLMNQRAQLVDAWRQIAVTANSLLGVFNVEYHL